MLTDAALSFFHFALLLILVGSLSAEAFLLRLAPRADVIRALARADAFYGASAVALVAAGVGRVVFGLKDESFYLASHAFWGKMVVIGLIAILSIPPTLAFLRWTRALRADPQFLPADKEWKSARRLVMIELHVLPLAVLFAILMARGLG